MDCGLIVVYPKAVIQIYIILELKNKPTRIPHYQTTNDMKYVLSYNCIHDVLLSQQEV